MSKVKSTLKKCRKPVTCLIMCTGISICNAALAQTVIRVHGEDGLTVQQGGDGLSWSTSFKFLQDGLDEAEFQIGLPQVNSVEVWVAGSFNPSDTWRIYKPDQDSNNASGSDDRNASFSMINNVSIIGGFTFGDNSVDDRDPGTFSLLSGNIGDQDSQDDNSRSVVRAGSSTDRTAVLDGFVIFDGNNNFGGTGGGIRISGSPVIRNCQISFNRADRGAGIGSTQLDSNPEIRNCLIERNVAAARGGGIYLRGGGAILNSNIFANTSEDGGSIVGEPRGGAGMYLERFELPIDIVGCNISENVASIEKGGGIYVDSAGTDPTDGQVTIVNSLIARNDALGGSGGNAGKGGGIYIQDDGKVSIINCTVVRNRALGADGLLNDQSESAFQPVPTKVVNSIFWEYDGVSIIDQTTQMEVTYSDIQHCSDPFQCIYAAAQYNNINADPQFLTGSESGAGWMIPCTSPVVNRGLDSEVPCDKHDIDEDGRSEQNCNPEEGDPFLSCGEPTPDGLLRLRIRKDAVIDQNGTNVDMGYREAITQHNDCPADITGDSRVDVDDMAVVFINWGCENRDANGDFVYCPGDITGGSNGSCTDGEVNVDDLGDIFVA